MKDFLTSLLSRKFLVLVAGILALITQNQIFSPDSGWAKVVAMASMIIGYFVANVVEYKAELKSDTIKNLNAAGASANPLPKP